MPSRVTHAVKQSKSLILEFNITKIHVKNKLKHLLV